MGQKEFAGHIFLHRFPPGCIPGAEVAHRIARYQFRRQYFVLRFSVFLFFGRMPPWAAPGRLRASGSGAA